MRQFYWHEIRRRRKNRNRKARAGKNSFPPTPFLFARPSGLVSAAQSAAISRSFVQKRFELRSAIAIVNFWCGALGAAAPERSSVLGRHEGRVRFSEPRKI